jgi:hypothetical protein
MTASTIAGPFDSLRSLRTDPVRHLLAGGQDDLLQLDDVGTVRVAVADAGDDVAGFERVAVPAVAGHALGTRTADAPSLYLAGVGFDLEVDHHVRFGPVESGHGPCEGDRSRAIDRPGVMRAE